MKDFRECMKEQGIDLPPHGPRGPHGRGGIGRPGPTANQDPRPEPPDPAAYQQAFDACKDKLPQPDPEVQAKFEEFRSCMAEHGIELPELPQPGQLPQPPDPNAEPAEPQRPDLTAFKAAYEACKDKLPTGPDGRPLHYPMPGHPGGPGHRGGPGGPGGPGGGICIPGQPPQPEQPEPTQPPGTVQGEESNNTETS